MINYRLISSKQLIAELFSDFNIANTDWVEKAQRHIERGISIMEVDGYYERAYSYKTVRDYKAALPCDSKNIIATIVAGCPFYRLPLTNSLSLGVNFKDLKLHTHYQGSINFNHLQTNFKEGNILFVYYRIPLDDAGDLLIPDNPHVLEALPYFVIYKLSLSGYVHPVINIDRAEAKWRELYPRARNSVNFPSIEEKHEGMLKYTNPLFTNIINEDWARINADESMSVTEFIEELKLLRAVSTE